MTRINSAIPVRHLTDEHLLAEHREIKRLSAAFTRAVSSPNGLKNIPTKFCLGTGHVRFFLNKQAFIFARYMDIYNECKRRGFNVECYKENWRGKVGELMDKMGCWKQYNPTLHEYGLLTERISTRIKNSQKRYFHYYGNQITKDKAVDLLLGQAPDLTDSTPIIARPVPAEDIKKQHPTLAKPNDYGKETLEYAEELYREQQEFYFRHF